MTIHVLVEGASESAFFESWTQRLLKQHEVRVHQHEGKGTLPANLDSRPDPKQRQLLHQLPAKLRGFASALDPTTDRVIVLLDADDDDVTQLTRRIQDAINRCAPNLTVAIQFAIEETEAFYLGDLRALKKAFPNADLKAAKAYVPDSICGTWELFGRVIDDDSGAKVAWAEAMGPVVTIKPEVSRSPSFRILLNTLRELAVTSKPMKRKRPYRHSSKRVKR